MIAQAVEAELQQLLAQHQNVMVDGKQAIGRNGFFPERTLQTGVGDVEVQLPKVRDRSGNGVKFNSNLIPPYLKRTKSVATLLPLLYLQGISTGDMLPVLESLLDKDVKGLSANSICHFKERWYAQYEQQRRRDLSKFMFGLTVFTVTLGWTMSSAYSSSLVWMTLDAKKSLALLVSRKRLLSAGLKRPSNGAGYIRQGAQKRTTTNEGSTARYLDGRNQR